MSTSVHSRLSLVRFQQEFLAALAAPQTRMLDRIGLAVPGGLYCVAVSEIAFVEFVPRAITPLPGTDHAILGLGHCHGRTLMLIDVRMALTGTPCSLDRHQRVIALRHDLGLVGELADLEGAAQVPDLLQDPRLAKLLQSGQSSAHSAAH